MEFGDILKILRTEKNMNQSDLATLLSVDRSTVGKWESNSSNPDFSKLKMIAATFDVSTDFLLGVNRQPNTSHTLDQNEELIVLTINRVMSCSRNKLFSINETQAIEEHLAELLLRYKMLINAAADSKMGLRKFTYAYQQYNSERESPLSDSEIKELYFKQNLDRELSLLQIYIDFLPTQLTMYASSNETITKTDTEEL